MPEQVYIGNFAKGLTTNRLPFNIDNDAFPTMFNFYAWRGRAKRKRGTVALGRLTKQVISVTPVTTDWQDPALPLVAGAANLISGFSLEGDPTIKPGSISFTVGGNTYTEPTIPNGTLLKNGVADPNSSINYATGAVFIQGGGVGPLTGTFSFYPNLPVMGLEDFTPPPPPTSTVNTQYPLLLAFDTLYSYQVNQSFSPVRFYNTTYYKGSDIPFNWNGQDYQQFWSTNYAGAFWVTNNVPGLHFVNATYTSGSTTAAITFNFKSLGVNYTELIVGSKVWFNEWAAGGVTINGLTGTVSDDTDSANGNYVVTFSTVQTVSGSGIAQLLNNSIAGQDGIRWYDGDPTNGTGLPTGTGLGWVNFAPPLTATTVSIDNTPAKKYYLVGALAILPFKDRLLFFSPYIQAAGENPIQLPDTVLWSWDGTPYYNAVLPGIPTLQTFNVIAFYVDQTGAGGYLPAGISQPIITVSNNEDALIIGFGGDGRKTRFVFTGNDFQPFLFFNINSELPSSATFSAVSLDRGVIDIGQYGIAMTDQQSSSRVDLQIPDSVFQIQTLNNGIQRVNAIRDYFKEWIYFTYPATGYRALAKFPNQSFLFNYRDNTWSILYENYTHHGYYRAQTKRTWRSIGFKTWATWREPWNSASSQALFTNVVAGNPQGFVQIIGQGTGESPSGNIVAVQNNGGNTQITSINHCVTDANPNTDSGDYLYFLGGLGVSFLNNQIGKVILVIDADNFVVDVPFSLTPVTYLGLGTFTRLSQPFLQTKQFNPYWEQGRKARLSVQKYLMDTTDDSQVTVEIFLNQDPDTPWNAGAIVPSTNPNSENSALIYSQVMYTCPESTNIGLTPANTNLQMPTAAEQFQIWHRFNTSLIGDSFQIGITLSDAQMRDITNVMDEITLHGMQLTFEKSQHLA